MRILLIGPQGSGKSTQAGLLAQSLGVVKITMGDIFRQIAASDTEEGKRIKQILDAGRLVDDQTTAELVKKRIGEKDTKNGFIMDGYPRTMAQVEIFEPDFDKVIYLKVPREEVFSRLLQRGRNDDTAELINKRLDLYYQQTESLLDHYRQHGILVEVDGVGDAQRIRDEIKKSL